MASFGAVKRASNFHHTRPTFLRHIPSPPSGYVIPPRRKDHESISNSTFVSRMALYQRAYTSLSPAEWKHYAHFGIQTFESFEGFFQSIQYSSEEEENLRIAHYYKYHLEHDIIVPSSLLKRVGEIEIIFDALSIHEGILHLSLSEMESYLAKEDGNKHLKVIPNTPDTNTSYVDKNSYPDSPLPGSDEINDPNEMFFDDDISMDIPESEDMESFETSPFGKGQDFERLLVESVVRLENKFNDEFFPPLPDDDDGDQLTKSPLKPKSKKSSTQMYNRKTMLINDNDSSNPIQAISSLQKAATLSSTELNNNQTETYYPDSKHPTANVSSMKDISMENTKSQATDLSTPPRSGKTTQVKNLSPSAKTSVMKSESQKLKATNNCPLLSNPIRQPQVETSLSKESNNPETLNFKSQESKKPPTKSTRLIPSQLDSSIPIIRIEIRWAPKDFAVIRNSVSRMHERLAPILSQLNSSSVKLVEWQQDFLISNENNKALLPNQVSKAISIRIVTANQQKCFFFGIRVQAIGQDFIKSLKTKAFRNIIKGETMQLSPSMIDCSESEIVTIGDILLKDAEVTHRQKYVEYLRNEILPADTPKFDIKIRRSDPLKNKTLILSVKCSSRHMMQLTTILSNALNGEKEQSEIFISNIGLTTNKTTRIEHEQIYRIHQEYLEDIRRIALPQTRFIDTEIVEHLDSGETINRTPRQWAKQLKDEKNIFCGIDIESGASNGKTYLLVPSKYFQFAKQSLDIYLRQQNPALMKAASICAKAIHDPSIPEIVFTKNITSMLNKSFGKATNQLNDNQSNSMDIDDVSTATEKTSQSNAPKNAWNTPLISLKKKDKKNLVKKVNKQNLNLSEVEGMEFSEERTTSLTGIPTITTISSLTGDGKGEKEKLVAYIADLEARLDVAQSKSSKKSSPDQSRQSKMGASKASTITGNSDPSETDTLKSRISNVETSVRDFKRMLENFLNNQTAVHSGHTASTIDISYSTASKTESPNSLGSSLSVKSNNKDSLVLHPNSRKNTSMKPLSTASVSKLAVVLQQRQNNQATASHSHLTILPHVKFTKTSSPQVTPIGKKRRTTITSSPEITAKQSQYNSNDDSCEMAE